MNRRAFLQRVGLGVAGALALAHVPAAIVKTVVGEQTARRYASEYLRRVYNDHCKGRPISEHPHRMEAGRELFEAFEGELIANERFTSAPEIGGPRNLRFKGARLDCVGAGWVARVVA